MTEPSDDEPRKVRVPVRRGPNPLASPETAEVPEDTAAHWSENIWHDSPPR